MTEIKLAILVAGLLLFLLGVIVVLSERAQDRAVELARCEAREGGYQSSIRDLTRSIDSTQLERLRDNVREVGQEIPSAQVDGDACARARAPDALLRQLRDHAAD